MIVADVNGSGRELWFQKIGGYQDGVLQDDETINVMSYFLPFDKGRIFDEYGGFLSELRLIFIEEE